VASSRQRWEQQALEMREARSLGELVTRFGEPSHKEQHLGAEIWHYPLGAESGWLYSVHVSVSPDQQFQAYMHVEPTTIADSPRRSWWRLWRERA
jgi:hypothetical protein